MNIGVNYMREHVKETSRIHYVITNGGAQPNVVPATAQVWYFARADTHEDAEYLFDWIREGRRIYILGKGHNRYQLLAVEDLVDAVVGAAKERAAAGETFNVGAREFGTVREDLGALIAHAGSGSRLQPIPAKPAELALRALELMHLSPLAEWHYKTAHRDSFVDVAKAQRLLGWEPRYSNREALIRTYDWYLANRGRIAAAGVTHRVPWNQQALGLLKKIS